MRRDRFAAADRIDTLVRFCLDAHRIGSYAQRFGQPQLHLPLVRSQLRPLEHDHHVHVFNRPSEPPDNRDRIAEQIGADGILPSRIGVRIVLADVARARGAEDRVGHRVTHDIGVRMAEGAPLGWNGDAAENQRPAFDELVQVVSDADPRRRRRRRLRRRGARRLEIGCRRDFHVRRITRDDVHRITGVLRKRGLVGRLDAAAPDGHGFLEHLAPKGLRRLRHVDRVPRQRLDDHRRRVRVLDALHGVVDRHRHDRGAMIARAVDRARDHVRPHERPGCVVNQHDLRVACNRIERVGHRCLTRVAALDHSDAAEPGRRCTDQRARQRDDHFADARMRHERVHRLLKNAPAANLEKLLRHAGPEPLAGAARRDDSRHVHGWGSGTEVRFRL